MTLLNHQEDRQLSVDQIPHILPVQCESLVLLLVIDSLVLMDEQARPMGSEVHLVSLLLRLAVAAALEVLQIVVVVAVLRLVLELGRVIQVRRKIRRIVLRLQSVFCKMNKLTVPLPHAVEVVAVQQME